MEETGWTSFIFSWAAFPLVLFLLVAVGASITVAAIIVMVLQNKKLSEDQRSSNGSR